MQNTVGVFTVIHFYQMRLIAATFNRKLVNASVTADGRDPSSLAGRRAELLLGLALILELRMSESRLQTST